MRFLNANYLIGIGIATLALTLSLETHAQSMDEAAASDVFYNMKGGQTVLVSGSSDLGRLPEAVLSNDKKLLKEQEMWGLQPLIPPNGLVRVEDGPLVGKNISDRSGNVVGYTESILVDPATGLVHYLIGSGGEIGSGRYVPVPVSAVDLDSMKVWAGGSDVQTLEWYSSSQLDQKYPSQPINKEVLAVAPALVPTTVVAK
jgi:PRC-barrel domain